MKTSRQPFTATNYWGHPIWSPLDTVRLRKIQPELEQALTGIMLALDQKDPNCHREFITAVLNPPKGIDTVAAFESYCSGHLYRLIMRAALPAALELRARTIVRQIESHIAGSTLLDVGCGDGMVSWGLRHRCKFLTLVDVVDYVEPRIRQSVRFERFREGDPLPVTDTADTTLLITVLHHAADPVALLKSLAPHTRRLVLIESVFLDDPNRQIYPGLPGRGTAEQLMFAVFADWFYNRVIHRDVPVPFNFTTPSRWIEVLHSVGFETVAQENLGVDIAIVPEYHYLIRAEAKS